MNEKNISAASQELHIIDRKLLTLNGIIDVEEFGESYLTLHTERGTVYIEGNDLKIENLSKETSTISVTGKIDGLFFKTSQDAKGWFSKLFK